MIKDMGLQTLIINTGTFINETIVPFILTVAFLVFLWNVVQFFIIESSELEGRQKARRLALWGITAFVLILSIWGIVNILVAALGFDRSRSLTSDYIEERGISSPAATTDDVDISEGCFGLPVGFQYCWRRGTQLQYSEDFEWLADIIRGENQNEGE